MTADPRDDPDTAPEPGNRVAARGPRIDQLAWAALGLLALSWAILAVLFSLPIALGRPVPDDLIRSVVYLGLATVPHLMLAYSVWRTQVPQLVRHILVYAVSYLIISIFLAILAVTGGLGNPLESGIVCIALMVWHAGWPLSFLVMLSARRQPRPPSSVDD